MGLTVTEMAELIQRYTKAKTGRDVPIERIVTKDHAKFVGWYFDAKAHFGMDGWCFNLNDVDPAERQHAFLRRKGRTEEYLYQDGEWVFFQELEDGVFKP